MTTNAKILLAEDDAIAASQLNQSLLRLGYRITGVVDTGEGIIKNISEIMPDIILIDITLGGKIDGICAVQKVREQNDIPVIYITANSDNEVFERAKQTEPYAYLIKPFKIYQLQNSIEIALFKHHLKKKLKDSEDRYRTLFEVSDNAMMLVDENSTITMVNEQFENITGCSKASVENLKSWSYFFGASELSKLEERLHQEEDDNASQQNLESTLVDAKGNTRFVYINVKKVPGTNSHIISMNDISALKLAEQEILQLNKTLNTTNKGLSQEINLRQKIEKQLRYKATHDYLTGLPNRVLLFDRLKQAFAFEERHNDTLIALMILDLDNFKNINDTIGHLSGDILLKKVALGLLKCMRQYDTVGRLGGDEFVIIINDAGSIKDIITFAEKVQSIFQEPFDILGHQTYVTTSIGVAVFPLHGSTIETLLKKADIAMYVAKRSGRNTFRFFSDSMDIQDFTQKNMRTKRQLSQMEKAAQNTHLTIANSPSAKEQLSH